MFSSGVHLVYKVVVNFLDIVHCMHITVNVEFLTTVIMHSLNVM